MKYRIDVYAVACVVASSFTARSFRASRCGGLYIAEKRVPQPPPRRVQAQGAGKTTGRPRLDQPSVNGEDAVIPYPRQGSSQRAFRELRGYLGFPGQQNDSEKHRRALWHGARDRPDRRRKTTKLYGALSKFDRPRTDHHDRDPSSTAQRITQIPINERKASPFARGPAIHLRHDPDISWLGEMRTRDRPDRTSVGRTGPIVFTTVHCVLITSRRARTILNRASNSTSSSGE